MHHLSTALCVDWLSQQKSMVNRFLLENIKQNKEYKCYTLSHPETCWVFGDHAMGCRTSASPVICSIRHHDYSVYSSFPKSCSSSRFMFLNFALFHVSELRFVSCFWTLLCFMFPLYFTFLSPLFYFCSPNPDPDICLIPATLTWFSSILIRSKPHVCSSVWNRHWLSLELLIQTSEPSPVSRLKFEDSRCLVAQHISWSQVLAEHIEPQYALGPVDLTSLGTMHIIMVYPCQHLFHI